MSAPSQSPVRVMLVDDSSAVRRMLAAALSVHPEIRVVGSAENGLIALERLPQLSPELVILDVEMPVLDGLTTLERLRERYPRLPVIMFSTLTERGARTTFDALAKGASDYVLKPSSQGETLSQVVSQTLVPKILELTRSRLALALQAAASAVLTGSGNLAQKRASELTPARPSSLRPSCEHGASLSSAAARPSTVEPSAFPDRGSGQLARLQPVAAQPAAAPAAAREPLQRVAPTQLAPPGKKPVQVVAIAASTGGPSALSEVLTRLPGALPVPVLVVQHMPALFTRCLAERLADRCALKVLESAGQELLVAGTVYIAPGSRHLEVVRDGNAVRTLLSDAPPENSCRPAADVLFRSVARVYGGNALCMVLTGMGHDGLAGAREVFRQGGRVLVQSGPTCVIWGMPRAVEEAGVAEAVVPLEGLAEALLRRVGLGLLPLRPKEAP